MQTHEARQLVRQIRAHALRERSEYGYPKIVPYCYVSEGRIVMAGNAGTHTLNVSASNEARVRAHWGAFLDANQCAD